MIHQIHTIWFHRIVNIKIEGSENFSVHLKKKKKQSVVSNKNKEIVAFGEF